MGEEDFVDGIANLVGQALESEGNGRTNDDRLLTLKLSILQNDLE